MLRNDWFIEDPQNEETVTLLAVVINISPFTQTRTARFVENVSDFFSEIFHYCRKCFPVFTPRKKFWETVFSNSVSSFAGTDATLLPYAGG